MSVHNTIQGKVTTRETTNTCGLVVKIEKFVKGIDKRKRCTYLWEFNKENVLNTTAERYATYKDVSGTPIILAFPDNESRRHFLYAVGDRRWQKGSLKTCVEVFAHKTGTPLTDKERELLYEEKHYDSVLYGRDGN